MAVFTSVVSIISAFYWTYADVFVMLISIALSSRFRLLNVHLKQAKGKVSGQNTTNQQHGTESFLRSKLFLSYVINSPHPGGLLLYSEKLFNHIYPERNPPISCHDFAKDLSNNRYKGAVNNTTSISNDVYREWKFNYMFRPDTAIIKFTSKGYQKFVTTMLFYKEGEISSSGYNYVIINNLSWGGGFCNLGLCWHRLWCFRRYYSLCGFPCGVSS